MFLLLFSLKFLRPDNVNLNDFAFTTFHFGKFKEANIGTVPLMFKACLSKICISLHIKCATMLKRNYTD
jgi:hypothetical protein